MPHNNCRLQSGSQARHVRQLSRTASFLSRERHTGGQHKTTGFARVFKGCHRTGGSMLAITAPVSSWQSHRGNSHRPGCDSLTAQVPAWRVWSNNFAMHVTYKKWLADSQVRHDHNSWLAGWQSPSTIGSTASHRHSIVPTNKDRCNHSGCQRPCTPTCAQVTALGQAIVHGVGPQPLARPWRGRGGPLLRDGGVIQKPASRGRHSLS